jgi:uncharacterized protein (DUF2384 family)
MNLYQSKIRQLAEHVWDSEADADAFLNRPHTLLNGERPNDVAVSEEGANLVEAILLSLQWGLPR